MHMNARTYQTQFTAVEFVYARTRAHFFHFRSFVLWTANGVVTESETNLMCTNKVNTMDTHTYHHQIDTLQSNTTLQQQQQPNERIHMKLSEKALVNIQPQRVRYREPGSWPDASQSNLNG